MQHHLVVFFKAKGKSHWEAGKELLTVTAISAVPMLFGATAFKVGLGIHGIVHNGQNIRNLAEYFSILFLRGQLFLVATSFLATALYRLWNADGSYLRPDIINLFAFLLFGAIGIFYGINPTFAELNSSLVRNASLCFLSLSFVAYYYMAVLAAEKPQNAENVLKRDAANTANRLRRRREELSE